MVFLQGLLTASLQQILFNCLYDFAKNFSICLTFLHFPWFRWKCYEKFLFITENHNFWQKLKFHQKSQPNVRKNLEQLTMLNEILIFNININILKILTLVLILNLDFWEYWTRSWYCVWKKYWSWYWYWSWFFIRDNIDIDLDIEPKLGSSHDLPTSAVPICKRFLSAARGHSAYNVCMVCKLCVREKKVNLGSTKARSSRAKF